MKLDFSTLAFGYLINETRDMFSCEEYMSFPCNYPDDVTSFTALKSIDLSGWDTQNLKDASDMFSFNTGLTSVNLSGWNTCALTNCKQMFNDDISVSGRTTLYMDKYLDSLYNIESKGKQTIETDAGSFEYTVYTANIPSSVVKDVCGIDTLGLYKHVKDDNSDNDNIGKLMDVYINNLDDTLTFSKGTISFGIDGNGVLTYVQLSAGGLGTSMKYTKEIVLNPSLDFRSLPDFSQSKEFIDNITDLANYVAKYDSYDDAMKALYKTDSDSTVSGNSSSSTASSSSETESSAESLTTESKK